jgi:hypothetical protein
MFLGLMHHLGHREARSQALMPGRYLTDGCRLLRVVSRLAAGREQVLVALEDCATLKVQAYAQSELGDLGLLAVRTADTAGTKSAEFSDSVQAGDRALAIAQTARDETERMGKWE